MRRVSRGTVPTAIVGVIAVALYAAWAAVQILVLNPLAAVPGRSLAEIRAEMQAVGEGVSEIPTIVLLSFGVMTAIGVAVVVIRSRMTPIGAALLFLGVLTMGAPAYFVASFGPGMNLADAYLISGGDHSPWAIPLYAISLLAMAAAAVLAVVFVRGSAGAPASAAAR